MSGHNKWSKVKHKKAATDAQKSKQFSKLSKLITMEVKKAGGDTENSGVRKAIEQAKAVNMPNDNIEKAIKRAKNSDEKDMEKVTYEAYGPEGVAMIIEGLTDNRNRTAAEVKSILSKHGIELAVPGSATWAFNKNEGSYETKTPVKITGSSKEKLSSIIESLEESEDIQEIYTNAE
ncbi:MAG: YebC/PmpR family DNA-binding transcriptional regulator [Candidatus Paceibacterota bacterium]